MSDKITREIHLTFQVLNFLSSPEAREPYKLVPFERELLIFLSKHIGHKGICPSVKTLAKEMNCSDRTLRRYFLSLTTKKLLEVEYKLGKPSQYKLLLPRTVIVSTQHTPDKSDPGQYVSVHPGQIKHDPGQIVSDNKKDRKRKKEKERSRTPLALPLSVGFAPSKACGSKARELGLTFDEAEIEYEKFIDHYVNTGQKKRDWNIVFMGWLKRAALYLGREPTTLAPIIPIIPKSEGKPYTPKDREQAVSSMQSVMAALRAKGLVK